MRRLVFALILMLGVYFVFARLAEFNTIAATLRRGEWHWLALAAVVQLTWVLNLGVSLRAVYRALGVEETLLDLTVLAIAANFINVVAPTAGIGGTALFIAHARRKGRSGVRVTLAGVLFVLYEYAGFLCVLALGLLVLIRRNNLTAAELTASAVLLAIALGLGGLMGLGLRSAQSLERALLALVRLVNRVVYPVLRREYLSARTAHHFAQDAAGALADLRRHPRNIALPLALALSSKALLISVLFLMFMAFRQPFSVGTLIAGFSIAYLFLIVSPTPSGIGVVEGLMALGLSSLHVPLAAAAVITLAYRAFTFWLPLLPGFLAFRYLQRQPRLGTEDLARAAAIDGENGGD